MRWVGLALLLSVAWPLHDIIRYRLPWRGPVWQMAYLWPLYLVAYIGGYILIGWRKLLVTVGVRSRHWKPPLWRG